MAAQESSEIKTQKVVKNGEIKGDMWRKTYQNAILFSGNMRATDHWVCAGGMEDIAMKK